MFSRSHTGKPGLKQALTMIIGGADGAVSQLSDEGSVGWFAALVARCREDDQEWT